MTSTEDILTEMLNGQDSQFFYAHRNPQSSVPLDGPDSRSYDISLEEVASGMHNEDESFMVDESRTWSFTSDAGDSFRFCDNDDGSLTLVSCENATEELAVPSEVDEKPVTAITFFAFANCKGLKSIICPKNATRIHSNAFKNCTALEKLVLPKNGNSINRAWLKALKQLRYLVLPDDLESISNKVFVSVDLDHLRIGANTRSIEAGAFNFSTIGDIEISPENTALFTDGKCIFKRAELASEDGKSADSPEKDTFALLSYYGEDDHYSIPAGCTLVFSNAFAYSKSLRTIGMPDSLEVIGSYAFSNSMLEEFIAPKNLREIHEKTFYFCSDMDRVILNDGLKIIGKEAFFKAPLKELYIPASVEEIQSHAFYNTQAAMAELGETGSSCDDATRASFKIVVSPDNPTLHIDAHGGLYERAPQGLVFLEMLSLTIREYELDPETIEIAPGAFLRHPCIESLVLPAHLRIIGDSAFRGCKSLGSTNFPESLEIIGKEAFVETVIKEAYIPKGLHSLGKMALRSSGKGFTHWLPGLKELRIHPENDRFFIDDGVLYQREDSRGAHSTVSALQYIGPNENVRILSGCTRIMPYAFAGISNIRKISLPAGIEHIGYSGLMFEDAPEEVTIELEEPYNGHESVTAYFSREIISNQCIRKALSSATLDIPAIFVQSDRAIIHTHDFYTRAKLALERLADPVYSTPESISLLQSAFVKELPRACREFAHNDFAKGFDYLIELGYITKDNMTAIINEISETNDVAMIGYLLELKHRNFASSVSLDLDL